MLRGFNITTAVTVYLLLTKITAVQNEVGISYHTVRGLCFLSVIFARSMFSVSYFCGKSSAMKEVKH